MSDYNKVKLSSSRPMRDMRTRIMMGLIVIFLILTIGLFFIPIDTEDPQAVRTASETFAAQRLATQARATEVAQAGATATVIANATPVPTVVRQAVDTCTDLAVLDDEADALRQSFSDISEVDTVIVEAPCGVGLSGRVPYRYVTIAFDVGTETYTDAAQRLLQDVTPILATSPTSDFITLIWSSDTRANEVLTNIPLQDLVDLVDENSTGIIERIFWSRLQGITTE